MMTDAHGAKAQHGCVDRGSSMDRKRSFKGVLEVHSGNESHHSTPIHHWHMMGASLTWLSAHRMTHVSWVCLFSTG